MFGTYWDEISTFEASMMTMLRANVGSLVNKKALLQLVYTSLATHNWLMVILAWFMATIVIKLMLGTVYISYFFSVVLYPYARYKIQADKTTTVQEDVAHRIEWVIQVRGAWALA